MGFLTVVDHEQVGLLGGYLILNSTARPVEFHCSAPLKANRAQEILYGPTLRPYLCGELIGATLLNKAKNRPDWVCTDCHDVLTARSSVSLPMALILNEDALANPMQDARPASPPMLQVINFPEQAFAVSREFSADGSLVTAKMKTLADSFDLLEPFERIRLAMEEAQRGAQR
ncbi:MAG: hypothetical protein MPJ50_11675 [Pirellulales bacterium]|nr:hypothetical protein [Pirellulales bacterium]